MVRIYRSPVQRVQEPRTDEGFFHHSVSTYYALDDDTKQTLYKGTTLARHCGISTNYGSMFLARKKRHMDGIYQSIWYSRRNNLQQKYPRVGSYFVTLSVCEEFSRRLEKKQGQKILLCYK